MAATSSVRLRVRDRIRSMIRLSAQGHGRQREQNVRRRLQGNLSLPVRAFSVQVFYERIVSSGFVRGSIPADTGRGFSALTRPTAYAR